MKHLVTLLAFVLIPSLAWAVEKPQNQLSIDKNKVLRGRFVQDLQMSLSQDPVSSSGNFVVAPAYGLIWNIEGPLPTSTVVTQNGATQNVGNIAMKLPIKNLRHLYDVVRMALAGNWNGLEKDFVITRSSSSGRWNMLLTPRDSNNVKLPYNAISISGNKFVENIVMTKADGRYDSLSFADEDLSTSRPTDKEIAMFSKAGAAK